MGRTLGFVFAASLLVVSAVSADLPLPKTLKYVDPRVRFEDVDKHMDYVFHLRYLTFTASPAGVPHTMVEVKDTKAFNLNAQRRLTDLRLLALERIEFEKQAKADPSLKWLNDKTESVLQASVPTPSTTASVSIKEVPVTTYRVTLKDGKLKVEMVKDKERSEAAPAGLVPPLASGLVSSISLAWFGIWFARRRNTINQPLGGSGMAEGR